MVPKRDRLAVSSRVLAGRGFSRGGLGNLEGGCRAGWGGLVQVGVNSCDRSRVSKVHSITQFMKVVGNLSPDVTDAAIAYIRQNLLPFATAEQAKCAKGRLNLWLQAEPDYRSGKYMPAHKDERLWKFCKKVYPQAALAQIYFADGGHGIDWHRDARYAKPEACIVNLGKVRLEMKLENGEIIGLDLVGSEIVQFNSKLLHRSIPVCDQRIGIGLWDDAIDITNRRFWQDCCIS